jgi:Flp pilus assembly pilin Flp
MLLPWLHSFGREDRAQDLVEYTLLIGFLALAAIGILSQTGVTIQGPWQTARATLDGTTATPAPAPADLPPSGGGHDDRGDHHDHRD